MAEVVLAITGGLFHSFVAWMLGLPYVLLGAAVVLTRGYPRWLGWIAVVAGSGALLAGTTRFLGFGLHDRRLAFDELLQAAPRHRLQGSEQLMVESLLH